MIPYNKINVGDIYSNPVFRNYGIEWVVLEKEATGQVVKIQDVKNIGNEHRAFWRSIKNRMFQESWRTFKGKGN